MTGVGNVVEVEVGGNQTIVGEKVAVGVMGEIWVSVASNVDVGAALQAQQIITKKEKYKSFFIHFNVPLWISFDFPSPKIKKQGD